MSPLGDLGATLPPTMFRRFALPLIALAACNTAPELDQTTSNVVYGTDDRIEVELHPTAAIRQRGLESVAMMVDSSLVNVSGTSVSFNYSTTLGDARYLCDGEAFADQVNPGSCSGTLIDSQHLLTAGHCVDSTDACTGNAWVFGYRVDTDGGYADLSSDDVYSCDSVVAYRQDRDGDVDYAVVRLDREVVGHTPAPVGVYSGGLAVNTSVALIGHPSGLPMKADTGGVVMTTSTDSFTATVDAFGGNSGSGVFELDGTLVGILTAGATDYVRSGRCFVVNVITSTSVGEHVVYIGNALEDFCDTPGLVSEVCDCDGPCVEAGDGDSCDAPNEIDAVTQTLSGATSDFTGLYTGSCAGAGPEEVYHFSVDSTQEFTASTSGFDSVLYLRSGSCDGGTEELCNDDVVSGNQGSSISGTLEAGDYWLFVDSYDASGGSYQLSLTFDDLAMIGDAGIEEDDAGSISLLDAGVTDAGEEGPKSTTYGCSCAGAPLDASGSLPMFLVAFGLLFRRRR